MPEVKSGTISKSVRVGKLTGVGFLNVPTSRGDVKMYHGDHIVEVDYTRPARAGEAGASVTKTHKFVVPEDCAKALGIFLKESVEEEKARWVAEAEAKKVADAEAAAQKAAEEAAKAAAAQ